jgi:hypothetical protein
VDDEPGVGQRAGEADIIVVVVPPTGPKEPEDGREMLGAVKALGAAGITLGGRPIHARLVYIQSLAQTVAAIRAANAQGPVGNTSGTATVVAPSPLNVNTS